MAQEELYLPFQRLDRYVYRQAEKETYILASIKVYLRHGEKLEPREANPVIPQGDFSVNLEFDVVGEGVENTKYLCELLPVKIKIAPAVFYPGSLADPDPAKKDYLRTKITERLKVADLPPTYISFTVKTVIFPPQGFVGGGVTNSIGKEGEIEISG